MNMSTRIQQRGKLLLIFVRASEVVALTKELKPEGLAFHIDDIKSETHLNNLCREVREIRK